MQRICCGMQALSPEDSAFDMVHLCSTLAANPFILAFSQRFASGRSAAAAHPAADSLPEAAASADVTGEMRTFCRSALRECIGQV